MRRWWKQFRCKHLAVISFDNERPGRISRIHGKRCLECGKVWKWIAIPSDFTLPRTRTFAKGKGTIG